MGNELDPIVGNWYRHLDKGQYFTVVAIDEEDGTVEIQHFDGDLEELDLADWPALDIELAEAPEDWTGPVDDVELDDLPYTETAMSAADWAEPLAETHTAEEHNEAPAASEGEEDTASPDALQEPADANAQRRT